MTKDEPREYQNDSPSSLNSLVFLAFKQSNTAFNNLLDWSNHITMPTMRRACVIALLPLLLASVRADDKPDLQKILDAWKAREQNTKSFDFRWRSKRFDDGSDHIPPSSRLQWAKKPADRVDPPDTTYIAKYRFLMDDKDRLRRERDDVEWSVEKNDYLPRTSVELFDGSINKLLYTDGASQFKIAFIGTDHTHIGELLWLWPVRLTFRPLTGGSAVFNRESLAISANSEGGDLIALKDAQLHSNTQLEVWVDPTKDFAPIRLTGTYKGNVVSRLSISHRHDPVDGWIPQAWTIEVYRNDGKLKMSESATVTEHSINKSAAESDFDLDLSSGGVWVTDRSYDNVYILRPDGTKRPILKGEFNGHNYEELMNSEPRSLKK